MKQCTKCGEAKASTGFHHDSRSKDGLRSTCKDCRSAYMASYYVSVRDERRIYAADYRTKNAERLRAEDAARYAANRERKLDWQAAYNEANPHVQWANGYRKRARRYGYPLVVEDFSKDDVIDRYGDACAHCGGDFEELDHYPVAVALGGHHTLNNVRPSCFRCNRAEAAAIREERKGA